MQRKRKGRRSRGRDDGGTNKSQNGGDGGGDDGKLRIRPVTYLNGNPGTRSTPAEPIFMISLADRDGSIETIAMSVKDTKKLIIDGLIALHEAHQPFATYLIDRYFKVDCPHPHDDWSTEN